MMLNTGRWLAKFLVPDADRAERRPGGEFAAYYWWNSSFREDAVKDISTSGVFVFTKERFAPGTVIGITLQKAGPLEFNKDRRITKRARVVRVADDGVGLAFLAPDDPETRFWDDFVEEKIDQARLAQMQDLARMVSALTFLNQICSGSPEMVQLVRERLSSHRLAVALEIMLKAQNLLNANPAGQSADPRLVVRVLENGSSTEETWLHDLWAGLLVSSCWRDKDYSNLRFIDQFSQFTSIPLRIFTVVCKAAKFHSEPGSMVPKPIECTIDELTRITGARELQVQRDLERLAQFGLIELVTHDSHPAPAEGVVSVTPTRFALELFARCNGHRGAPEHFYAARNHRAGLAPAPSAVPG
jgi:hypothetical protein